MNHTGKQKESWSKNQGKVKVEKHSGLSLTKQEAMGRPHRVLASTPNGAAGHLETQSQETATVAPAAMGAAA